VSLGWDKDDDKRKRMLRGKKATAEDMAEDDLRAYLGSGSEHESDGSDDEGNDAAAKCAPNQPTTQPRPPPVGCLGCEAATPDSEHLAPRSLSHRV
jgi:hypothetical protein